MKGKTPIPLLPEASWPLYQRRFWFKVEQRGPDECWPWRRQMYGNEYGDFKLGKRVVSSHRMAFAIANQQDPGFMMVLHKCDNRACCNPAHLYLGDVKQNSRDMVERGRGRNGNRVGSRNGANKLTEEDVASIRRLIAEGARNQDIAPLFGVTHQMISKIRCGHYWKHVGTGEGEAA